MLIDGIMIRNRRKELGFTQQQLAKKAVCTQPVICQIENGEYNHKLNLVVIKNICSLLMLDIDKVVKSKKNIKLHQFKNITIEDMFLMDYDVRNILTEVEPFLETQRMKIRHNYISGIRQFLNDNSVEAINCLQPVLYFWNNKKEGGFEQLVTMALLSFSYFSIEKYILSTQYLSAFVEMAQYVDDSYLERSVMYNLYAGLIYICYENKLLDYAEYLHSLCYHITQKYIRLSYLKKIAKNSENKKIVDAVDKLNQPIDKSPDYGLF